MPKVKSTRFHLVSLGCSKNTVDSESMAQLLGRAGMAATDNAREAEVLIVNTCGFIGPAKQESLDVLNELAAGKRRGQLLIAAGCLSQRYGADVIRQVPGIDGIIGTRRWMDIVDLVQRLRARPHPEPLYHLPESASVVGRTSRARCAPPSRAKAPISRSPMAAGVHAPSAPSRSSRARPSRDLCR